MTFCLAPILRAAAAAAAADDNSELRVQQHALPPTPCHPFPMMQHSTWPSHPTFPTPPATFPQPVQHPAPVFPITYSFPTTLLPQDSVILFLNYHPHKRPSQWSLAATSFFSFSTNESRGPQPAHRPGTKRTRFHHCHTNQSHPKSASIHQPG